MSLNALDDIVTPNATVEQAFALMQQARIDALEKDFSSLSHEVKAVAAKQASPAPPPTLRKVRCQPPLAPEPDAPVSPTATAVYEIWQAQQDLKREECLKRHRVQKCFDSVFECLLGLTIVLVLCGGVGAAVSYDVVYVAQNTAAYAVVEAVVANVPPGKWQPVCNTTISWLSHDNAAHVGTVSLDATAGVCDQIQVGSTIFICYRRLKPQDYAVGTSEKGCGDISYMDCGFLAWVHSSWPCSLFSGSPSTSLRSITCLHLLTVQATETS